jgi:hypothetical protein
MPSKRQKSDGDDTAKRACARNGHQRASVKKLELRPGYDQGIATDLRGQDQPKDKKRAQG